MDYKIMHKEKVIALANENGISEIIDKSLCPACFVIGMPLEIWLDNRCIDIHRSHSRKLFKALRLRTPDDIEQIIDVGHGISITDNWWIQKNDGELDYSSLKQYNEELADIALYGLLQTAEIQKATASSVPSEVTKRHGDTSMAAGICSSMVIRRSL